MRKINLLDWRGELVKQNQKNFGMACLLAALLGLMVFGGLTYFYNSTIKYHNDRNNRLTSEIKELEKQIKEVEELEKTRERLIARMEVIDNLQQSRPLIVEVFDDMARIVPEGTYFDKAKQTGNKIQFEGTTESSTRVSRLMRNIDASPTLKDPNLDTKGIVTSREGGRRVSEFGLIAQINPKKSEEDEE